VHSLSISSSLASFERNSVSILPHENQTAVNQTAVSRANFCSTLLIQTKMLMKKSNILELQYKNSRQMDLTDMQQC